MKIANEFSDYKRMQRSLGACVLATLCLASGGATAEIHKWIDADGKVQFGDRPPADQKTETIAVPKSPPPPASNQGSAAIKARQYLEDSKAEEAKRKEAAAEAAKQRNALSAQCGEVKANLATLERGGRITAPSVNGEPNFLSSEEIDAKRIEYRKLVKERCS